MDSMDEPRSPSLSTRPAASIIVFPLPSTLSSSSFSGQYGVQRNRGQLNRSNPPSPPVQAKTDLLVLFSDRPQSYSSRGSEPAGPQSGECGFYPRTHPNGPSLGRMPVLRPQEETMRPTRRRVLSGAVTIAAASTVFNRLVFAQGTKETIKVGGVFPSAHPASTAMENACAEVRSQSNNAIDIQFFPNAQLGSESAMISQLRSGAIGMMTSGLILSTLVPIAGITGISFAFKDYPEVWSALDGELGAQVRTGMDKVGIYTFPKCMDNGFRHITTSNKPVNTVHDLNNLKLRVPPNPVTVSAFSALGASPTSINLPELYTALQTKIVDGQENPLIVIDTGRFYEVQKFCSMTGHLWDGHWIIANARMWKSLPADAQSLISRVFDTAVLKQREDAENLNNSLEAALKERGLVFNSPERGQFRDALSKAGFYDDWKKKYGSEAWSKLEKYAGTLS